MNDLEPPAAASDHSAVERRVIKRYSNRKLYDTVESRYVTLQQIAEMVRAGQEVQIIDNATKEDKTDVTLALIISEELKARPKGIPLSTLRDLIREHGERLLNQLREGPIGKLITKEELESTTSPAPNTPEHANNPSTLEENGRENNMARGFRATLEQWQQAIDERVRTVMPSFSGFHELEQEVKHLSERVSTLETQLAQLAHQKQEHDEQQ